MPSPRGSLPIDTETAVLGASGLYKDHSFGRNDMTATTFSIPYNSDEKTLEALLSMQNDSGAIREVYLSGPEAFAASGRVARSMDIESFARIVSLIHGANVRVNLVMNSVCEGVEWYETRTQIATRRYLEWACGELGVESVTIANPLYLKEARRWLPNTELCASVLMDVDCIERAKIAADAGADVVTPDVNINRDLDLLKRIKDETGLALKVMVNEGCLYKCPWRKFHFNAVSHVGHNAGRVGVVLKRIKDETGLALKVMVNEGCLYKCPWRKFHFNAVSHVGHNAGRVGVDLSPEDFVSQCTQVAYRVFFQSCNRHIHEDRSQIFKSQWIRPEDLSLYSDVTTYFKISGRTMPKDALVNTVKAYLNESYSGNLLELLDSSIRSYAQHHGARVDNEALGAFGKHVLHCERRCDQCSYCESLAQSIISSIRSYAQHHGARVDNEALGAFGKHVLHCERRCDQCSYCESLAQSIIEER